MKNKDSRKELNLKPKNASEFAANCKAWVAENNPSPEKVPSLWKAYAQLSLAAAYADIDSDEWESIFKMGKWILKEKK